MATETVAINIERNDRGLAWRCVDPSQVEWAREWFKEWETTAARIDRISQIRAAAMLTLQPIHDTAG